VVGVLPADAADHGHRLPALYVLNTSMEGVFNPRLRK